MLIVSVRGGIGFGFLIGHCKALVHSLIKEQSAELIKLCCRLNVFSNFIRTENHWSKWCALGFALQARVNRIADAHEACPSDGGAFKAPHLPSRS